MHAFRRHQILYTLIFLCVAACDPASPPPPAPRHTSTPSTLKERVPAAAAPQAPPAFAPATRAASWYRGVSLGLFASTADPQAQRQIYGMLLDEIVGVGATDVSLVVRWAQRDIEATSIAPTDPLTPPDELVQWVVEQAHARGLRVFVMPILHLEKRGRGAWRGTLEPSDEEGWWRSYTAFILHYATLLANARIELFSVGSELLNMEPEKARWVRLIKQVRRVLPKTKLTYSSNWDSFEVPQFWDKLDVVGMTAYQELSSKRDPSVAELKQGWWSFEQRLDLWAREFDRHYIFTEVGYPSHALGAKYPWDYVSKSDPDPALQARCYQALMEQWHDKKRLKGLFLWNWFGPKSLEDRGYSPRGKPAEMILKHWFRDSLP